MSVAAWRRGPSWCGCSCFCVRGSRRQPRHGHAAPTRPLLPGPGFLEKTRGGRWAACFPKTVISCQNQRPRRPLRRRTAVQPPGPQRGSEQQPASRSALTPQPGLRTRALDLLSVPQNRREMLCAKKKSPHSVLHSQRTRQFPAAHSSPGPAGWVFSPPWFSADAACVRPVASSLI